MATRRSKRNPLSVSNFLIVGAFVLAASGCSVQDHKNGQAENVRLHTPIGSLDVRTNAIHGPDVGLPVYPGAVETGKHGNDSGSADIHMSFGNWRLNVKAIEYHSDDQEDKIVAFYKNAMAQYGDVLTCRNKTALGEPSKTKQGLTCANDHEYDVNMKLDRSNKPATVQTPQMSGDIKLLAGSPENQHIVKFSPSSNGTKFSMVVVQLPQKRGTD
jgi:hypothetical protein